MQSGIEKVTLSLNRVLLEKMAKRVKKNRSEFVRDLIQREAGFITDELTLSPEILELKGSLKRSGKSTKSKVHTSAKRKLKAYDRS